MSDHDVGKKRQSVSGALSSDNWPAESTLDSPFKRSKTVLVEGQGGNANVSGTDETNDVSVDTIANTSVTEAVPLLVRTKQPVKIDSSELPLNNAGKYITSQSPSRPMSSELDIADSSKKAVTDPLLIASPFTDEGNKPQSPENAERSTVSLPQETSSDHVSDATALSQRNSISDESPTAQRDGLDERAPQHDAPPLILLEDQPASSDMVPEPSTSLPTATDNLDQISSSITNEQLVQALTSAIPIDPPGLQEKKESSLAKTGPPEPVQPEHTQPTKPEAVEGIPRSDASPHTQSPSAAQAKNTNATATSNLSAFGNLPGIQAALRRLSGATGLDPSFLRTGDAGREDQAIPSEILGNALAAVVNASAARSNASTTPASAAAAFGNLAANFSQFLNASSNFAAAQHRASISQDEKADKAGGSRPSGGNRRKSAIAGSNGSALVQDDPAAQIKKTKKPQLIVKNEQVWKAVEGMDEKMLGFYLYKPGMLLPNMEDSINGIMEIRIPARFLNYHNTQVKKRSLWGTDIYTDDSDVVAMIIHSGKYLPPFQDPEVHANDPLALAIAGKAAEAAQAAKKLAIAGKAQRPGEPTVPDHDVKVTLRVLPRLRNYASTIRHRIKSRTWGGNHDGVSFYIDNVEKIKKGEARPRGRSTLKSHGFAYETYRRRALGLEDVATGPSPLTEASTRHGGRMKRAPRVLRPQALSSASTALP